MSDESRLPKDPTAWEAASNQLVWKSIHHYGLACSGSGISREQFILLRTLWKSHTIDSLYARDRSTWIDDSSFQEAQRFLSSSAIASTWQRFLESTGTPPKTLEEQGYAGLDTFSLVRYEPNRQEDKKSAQTESCRPILPDPDPEAPRSGTAYRGGSPAPYETPEDFSSPFEDPRVFKAIQDEQIVNTALIEYLNALAIHCTELEANWTLHRLPLIARDHTGTKTYEARVDGYLKSRQDEQPLAIMEVKPFTRKTKKAAIRMQESAQMASWINQYRPLNMSQLRATGEKIRRLLISQDRHLIYLNFADFDASYVDYICDKQGININEVSFLRMNEYGPFDVGNQSAMSMLGELVLGYALGESRKAVAGS
ncbi:hypothetical protein GQX73_g7965 [Xylaria multiplex]|uniref:Uncharacterized protein n=1 Tax=Xylaria multiplex TaxID=323545 RepID=A0A7C8IQ77_9PEZI|nr:hypothetical protein GQX73_g7965 [Xylaria multiplex]